MTTVDDQGDHAAGTARLVLALRASTLPKGAPAHLAVLAHGPLDSCLAIADLRAGRVVPVQVDRGMPADPVWTPDGRRLLFRLGGELMLCEASGTGLRRATAVLPGTACAVDRTGRFVAVADDGAVRVEGLDAAAARARPDAATRFPLPDGERFRRALWTPDGRGLVVLSIGDPTAAGPDFDAIAAAAAKAEAEGRDPVAAATAAAAAQAAARAAAPPSAPPASVSWIDLRDGKTRVQRVADVTDLLGFERTGGGLVVARSAAGGGEEPAVLGSGGGVAPFREADPPHPGAKASGDDPRDDPEPGHPELLVGYAPTPRQAITLAMTEDTGDPARVAILPPGRAPRQPWLEAFERLDQLSLAADGAWAVFVDRAPAEEIGAAGGAILAVPLGRQRPVRILAIEADGCTFDRPVLGPAV